MGHFVRMAVALNADQAEKLKGMRLFQERYRVEEGKGTVRQRDNSVITDEFYRVWTETGRSLTILKRHGEGPSTYGFEANFGANGSTRFSESVFRALRLVGVEQFDLGIDDKNAEACRRVSHYWGAGDGSFVDSLLVKGVTAHALSRIFCDPEEIAGDYPECPDPDCEQSRVGINHMGGGAVHGGHKWYCYGCCNTFD